uniref:Uncharacterized protein n=1 Tax=Arundo donax TaxID=35708 RepID=A0A0A9CP89_ARUDO
MVAGHGFGCISTSQFVISQRNVTYFAFLHLQSFWFVEFGFFVLTRSCNKPPLDVEDHSLPTYCSGGDEEIPLSSSDDEPGNHYYGDQEDFVVANQPLQDSDQDFAVACSSAEGGNCERLIFRDGAMAMAAIFIILDMNQILLLRNCQFSKTSKKLQLDSLRPKTIHAEGLLVGRRRALLHTIQGL